MDLLPLQTYGDCMRAIARVQEDLRETKDLQQKHNLVMDESVRSMENFYARVTSSVTNYLYDCGPSMVALKSAYEDSRKMVTVLETRWTTGLAAIETIKQALETVQQEDDNVFVTSSSSAPLGVSPQKAAFLKNLQPLSLDSPSIPPCRASSSMNVTLEAKGSSLVPIPVMPQAPPSVLAPPPPPLVVDGDRSRSLSGSSGRRRGSSHSSKSSRKVSFKKEAAKQRAQRKALEERERAKKKIKEDKHQKEKSKEDMSKKDMTKKDTSKEDKTKKDTSKEDHTSSSVSSTPPSRIQSPSTTTHGGGAIASGRKGCAEHVVPVSPLPAVPSVTHSPAPPKKMAALATLSTVHPEADIPQLKRKPSIRMGKDNKARRTLLGLLKRYPATFHPTGFDEEEIKQAWEKVVGHFNKDVLYRELNPYREFEADDAENQLEYYQTAGRGFAREGEAYDGKYGPSFAEDCVFLLEEGVEILSAYEEESDEDDVKRDKNVSEK